MWPSSVISEIVSFTNPGLGTRLGIPFSHPGPRNREAARKRLLVARAVLYSPRQSFNSGSRSGLVLDPVDIAVGQRERAMTGEVPRVDHTHARIVSQPKDCRVPAGWEVHASIGGLRQGRTFPGVLKGRCTALRPGDGQGCS